MISKSIFIILKPLRPSDAYMRRQSNDHWFRKWLVAWSTPSHYLNQCWNIVNWTLGNKLQWNFNRNSNIFIEENTLENVVCEMLFISSRPQCFKPYMPQSGFHGLVLLFQVAQPCGGSIFQNIIPSTVMEQTWYIYIGLSYYHHQIGSMNYYPLFRVRSWNNGMRCMSFYIL